MIAIIDYGVGNLFSLKSSLDYLGLENCVTRRPEELKSASALILPGVGAFGDAMDKLKEDDLHHLVISETRAGKPILGICLGMQLLFEQGHEYGTHRGLGLLSGEIRSMKGVVDDPTLKIPHMGWNNLRFLQADPITKYLQEDTYVYYVHSYYAAGPRQQVLAVSEYGMEVPGIVRRDNIYGMQFHPEKSGTVGLNLLKAFGEFK